jgi:hypothetical protein
VMAVTSELQDSEAGAAKRLPVVLEHCGGGAGQGWQACTLANMVGAGHGQIVIALAVATTFLLAISPKSL